MGPVVKVEIDAEKLGLSSVYYDQVEDTHQKPQPGQKDDPTEPDLTRI